MNKKTYKRIWRKNNPDKVRASRNRWKKNNPDKVRASRNRWKKRNPDKVRAAKKRWLEKHRDEVREYHRKYRRGYNLLHQDKVKKYQRKYWEKYFLLHREKIREYNREYSLLHPRRRNGSHNWKYYPIDELIKRDGRKCKKCGVTKQLSINHKIPRIVYNDEGKIWDVPLKELEILCSKCNNDHYQRLVKKALRFYFRSKLQNKLN